MDEEIRDQDGLAAERGSGLMAEWEQDDDDDDGEETEESDGTDPESGEASAP